MILLSLKMLISIINLKHFQDNIEIKDAIPYSKECKRILVGDITATLDRYRVTSYLKLMLLSKHFIDDKLTVRKNKFVFFRNQIINIKSLLNFFKIIKINVIIHYSWNVERKLTIFMKVLPKKLFYWIHLAIRLWNLPQLITRNAKY